MSWLHRQSELVWLELHFGHQLDTSNVRAFLTNLLSDRHLGRVVLEVESNRHDVRWRLGCTNTQNLRRLLRTHLEQVTVTSTDRHLAVPTLAFQVQASGEGLLLAAPDLEAATAGLLGSLAVSGKARTVHQLIIGQRLAPEVVPQKLRSVPGRSWPQQLVSAALVGSESVESQERRRIADKRSQPGAIVSIRLGIHDPEDNYSRLPSGYIAALRAMASSGSHLALRRTGTDRVATATGPNSVGRSAIRLNVDELLSVLAWPFEQRSYPRIDRARSLKLPAASATTRPADTRSASNRSATTSFKLLGSCAYPGQQELGLRLSTKDALRHLIVRGPTGVGKSTLLANLILADIAANRSVVVIDPKSDLVDDLLARIPDQHLKRTVLVDLASQSRTVGFNPLAVHPSELHQAVDGIVHVFKSLHANSWGPRSEDILHASLLTLGQSGTASLIDIPTLLTQPSFRHQLTANTTDSTNSSIAAPLTAFWDWFDQLSTNERSHVIAPLLNKLRPFTLRPSLAATLSAPEPFTLSRVFTERLILLVPLRKGRVGSEVAELFGSLLVAELWRTIQTRASVSRERRHPSFIYADEFQHYVRLPTDFADVLAQSRGLGVGWTLAHQNLDQLPKGLQRSVAANAQNKVFFRLSADDAARVATTTDQLRPSDLTGLPAFEAYAQTLASGQLNRFASIRTHPLRAPQRNPQAAARQLLRRWGTPITTAANRPSAPQRTNTSDEPSTTQIGRRKRSNADQGEGDSR